MQWNDRTLRRIKLRDLYILLAVIEERGIAKAGRRLAVSQPVISKAIANTESILGVRLLDRDAQGIQPTAFGLALMSRCLAVFDELHQGVDDINFLANPQAGHLRIGSTEPIASALIAPVVDQLIREFPKMTFDCAAGVTDSLFRNVAQREIEFAVMRMTPADVEPIFATEILFHDALVVAAGVNNPLLRRRKIRLNDLMDESWILSPPENYFGKRITDVFRANGLERPVSVVTTSSSSMRNELLSTGRYLAVVPGFSLKLPHPHPSLKPLPIDLSSSSRPIAIATLKRRSLSPLARMFVDKLRTITKPLARMR